MDLCIKRIFLLDKIILPIHSAPDQILGKERDMSKTLNILSLKVSSPGAKEHATIRVANQLTIKAEMESLGTFVPFCNGFKTFQRMQIYHPTNRVLLAREIYEDQENVPFRMLVTNS